MRQTTFDVAMIFSEREDNRLTNFAIIPLGFVGLVMVIIGLVSPGLMPIALGFVGLLTTFSAWFYVQITAMIVIGKIVIDCILWAYNGGQNHDYYE